MLLAIDHVQLAMPEGGEEAARQFFCDVLGLKEEEKPKALKGRGGCWFSAQNVRLHLGVEAEFNPACKAHPAFLVADLKEVIARLNEVGMPHEPDAPLPGVERIFIRDPFGNRIELLERVV
jgi:catechol 2,3-dioxygenase-like lactoylglutathione lyase family enzyme